MPRKKTPKHRRDLKKELIDGGVIEGPDFVIIRRTTALVPVNQQNKLQIVPKKRRPPLPGKTRWAFIRAFEDNRGNITKACKAAGISRQTLYRWLDSPTQLNERFRQRLRNTRPLEAKKDFYEECLEDIAAGFSEGNATAAIFGLKSLAGDRGYRDRAEERREETGDAIAIELRKLRKQFEIMAQRFGTDPRTEGKIFLEEFGPTLNPMLRTQLVSELEN